MALAIKFDFTEQEMTIIPEGRWEFENLNQIVSYTVSFWEPSKINLSAKRRAANWRVNLILHI